MPPREEVQVAGPRKRKSLLSSVTLVGQLDTRTMLALLTRSTLSCFQCQTTTSHNTAACRKKEGDKQKPKSLVTISSWRKKKLDSSG